MSDSGKHNGGPEGSNASHGSNGAGDNSGEGGRTRTIHVGYLARVEGEGALDVRVEDGRVAELKLRIFEPPRFFEAFLRGRSFTEAPDVTARICGICPVAYQMSSSRAMEDACGVTVDGQLRELRRLLYCGEWIESHTLHMYMLHAPDFLGKAGAVEIARENPQLVQRGLQLKKIGNDLMSLLGGREIHPINVRVGGFYRAPSGKELEPMLDRLKWARDAAIETVRWAGGFEFPELQRDYEFVALRDDEGGRYPMNEGRLVSNRGLDIAPAEYDEHFEELHVPHSTALHARKVGGGSYFVGPMARYALNFDRLPAIAQQTAREAGLGEVCTNPYKSILVRGVEVVFACDEAIRLIERYERPDRPAVDVEPRPATGYGLTEAPRGILYHRYRIDGTGTIEDAKIVPPTSQNQATIEQDLHEVLETNHELSDEALGWRCEQTIRNYDPCISCAAHFLQVNMERT